MTGCSQFADLSSDSLNAATLSAMLVVQVRGTRLEAGYPTPQPPGLLMNRTVLGYWLPPRLPLCSIMAQNYRQPGTILTLTVGATTSSGDPVVVSDLFGVIIAKDDSDNTMASVQVTGVFTLAKADALVISQGDALYWNTTNSNLDKTNTGKFVGHAIADAGSSDGTVEIRLQPAA